MTRELKQYIKECLRKGESASTIYHKCLNRGWNHYVVRAMIRHVGDELQTQTMRKRIFLAFSIIVASLLLSLFVGGRISGFFVLSSDSINNPDAPEFDFGSLGFGFGAQSGIVYLDPPSDFQMYEGYTYSNSNYFRANSTQVEDINFYGLEVNPAWATITGQDNGGPGTWAYGSLSLSPAISTIGNFTIFAIAVGNTSEDGDARSFRVEVLQNDPPELLHNVSNYTWYEDTVNSSLNLSYNFNDSNGHALTFGVVNYSDNFSKITFINNLTNNGVIHMVPEQDWYGSILVYFTAEDKVNLTNSNVVNLTVLNVPDAPNVTSIAINPEPLYSYNNLSASFIVVDSDNSSLEVNVSWYNNTASGWDLIFEESVNCTSGQVCTVNDSILYSDTAIGENWNCTIVASDGNLVSSSSTNLSITNSPPILNVSDNSNASNKLNVGQNVSINISWNDYDVDSIDIYVCNTSSINTSGCSDTELCSFLGQSSSGADICLIQVQQQDSNYSNRSYYIAACDGLICSAVSRGDYFINHAPNLFRKNFFAPLSENITTCSGDCGSGDNHELYLKFDLSEINQSVDVIFDYAELVFDVNEVLGNWSNITAIYDIQSDSWSNSFTYSELEALPNESYGALSGVNQTGTYSASISDLINQTTYNGDSLLSLRLASIYSGSKNNQSSSVFVIGNKNNLNLQNGSISVDNLFLNISYKHQLHSKTWKMNLPAPEFNLNDYFEDPDGDSLTYFVNGTSYLDISIESDGDVVINVPTLWYGQDSAVFTAQDSNGLNYSMDPVLFIVEYVPGISVPIPSSGGGGGSSRTEIASLDVKVPSVYMGSTDELYVPFSLFNSGEVDFSGINLSTFFDVKGLDVTFMDDTFISGLAVGETYSSELLLETSNVVEGNYSVELMAKTIYPSLSESGTIYITIQHKDFTNKSLQKEIAFAEDLFRQNPECLELMEVVFRAKDEVASSNFKEASEMLSQAVKDCRELISDDSQDLLDISFTAFLVQNIPIILIIAGVMIFVYIVAIALLRK